MRNSFTNKIKLNFFNLLLFFIAFFLCTRGIFPNVVDALIVTVGLLSFALSVKKVRVLKYSRIYFSFIIFVMCVFISSLYNQINPAKFTYYFIVFFAFIAIFEYKKDSAIVLIFIITVINVIQGVVVILGVLSIFDFSQFLYSRSGHVRASGFLGNPNYFAYSMFINMIFLYCYRRLFKRVFFITAYMIILFSIIFSFSRGVSAAAVIFTLFNVSNIIKLRYLPFIIIPAVYFIYTSILESDILLNTISYRVDNLLYGGGSGRSDIWLRGLDYIALNKNALMLGVGVNNFASFSLSLDLNNTVHNSFLRILFEGGLIVFCSFLFFIFNVIRYVSFKVNSFHLFVILLSLVGAWLSNDFLLNKETWLLFALFLYVDFEDKNYYSGEFKPDNFISSFS